MAFWSLDLAVTLRLKRSEYVSHCQSR